MLVKGGVGEAVLEFGFRQEFHVAVHEGDIPAVGVIARQVAGEDHQLRGSHLADADVAGVVEVATGLVLAGGAAGVLVGVAQRLGERGRQAPLRVALGVRERPGTDAVKLRPAHAEVLDLPLFVAEQRVAGGVAQNGHG